MPRKWGVIRHFAHHRVESRLERAAWLRLAAGFALAEAEPVGDNDVRYVPVGPCFADRHWTHTGLCEAIIPATTDHPHLRPLMRKRQRAHKPADVTRPGDYWWWHNQRDGCIKRARFCLRMAAQCLAESGDE